MPRTIKEHTRDQIKIEREGLRVIGLEQSDRTWEVRIVEQFNVDAVHCSAKGATLEEASDNTFNLYFGV